MKTLLYSKSRFSTRLPVDCRYTAGHFWIRDMGEGLFRVGLTRFATRMLGDLVEMGFAVKQHQAIFVGDTIGWVESLKAASDLYSVIEGSFIRENPDLIDFPELLDKTPYTDGWLFEARGSVDPDAVDVQGYKQALDQLIEKMLKEMDHDEIQRLS